MKLPDRRGQKRPAFVAGQLLSAKKLRQISTFRVIEDSRREPGQDALKNLACGLAGERDGQNAIGRRAAQERQVAV